MESFIVNASLDRDCITLGELNDGVVLLMNNSLIPWLIWVPRTQKTEIYELSQHEQKLMLDSINLLSRFIKNQFDIDKLNIASIGNIVKQMHVHIVGRNESDHCWPNVVWGTKTSTEYKQEQVSNLLGALAKELGSAFTIR